LRRLWALLLCGLSLSALADGAGRIVSINLCADALVLSLAPERVLAVSELARDERLSPVAARAASVPVTDGNAEAVLRLDPDLVVAGRFTTRATVALLKKLDVPVLELDTPTTLEATRAQIREVAGRLGVAARGERLVARLDAALARAADHPEVAPVAAVYLPNGATAGSGSLIDELLEHAGLVNLADQLGIRRWGTLSLESLLLAAPDLLIVEREHPYPSLATGLLGHPALAGLGADRVVLPGQYWSCAGPWLAEALGRLAGAARQHAAFPPLSDAVGEFENSPPSFPRTRESMPVCRHHDGEFLDPTPGGAGKRVWVPAFARTTVSYLARSPNSPTVS